MYRLPTRRNGIRLPGRAMTDKAESAFDFYLEKPTNTLLASQANFMDTNLKKDEQSRELLAKSARDIRHARQHRGVVSG